MPCWRLPVWSVEGLDGLCVEIFDGLLVAATDAVAGPGVAVERIDSFSDPHL